MGKEISNYFWANLKNLLCSSIGLCYFFCVIISDARGAYKKRAHWIPGKALVLSALTIQALSYLDVMSVSLSDQPNSLEVAMLLGNHLLIDSGRLIICVFMGYLLPGMACSGSKDQWGDILALAISLFGDIASELYFLHRCKYLFKYDKFEYDFLQQPSLQIWYKASSIGIVVSVLFLLFLLGTAIPTGSTIREILSQKIAAALTTEKGFEEKVFKSWLLARTCRPDYVIARSVLSSAVGVVVTLRIAFSLLKFKFLKYRDIIHYDDGLDQFRQIVLLLQILFIFLGWIVICSRWITAVLYFPKLNEMTSFFRVENFWRRRTMELRYDWQSHIADIKESISNDTTIFDNSVRYLQGFFLTLVQMFVPCFLIRLQILVVYFGKACWLLSSIFIGNRLFRRWLVRDNSKEFHKYNDILQRVRMPAETEDQLRIANQKALKRTKKHMKDGRKKGTDCQELIDFIRESHASEPKFDQVDIVEGSFPSLDKMCWMMTAVSYFEIIIKLFPEHVDRAKNVLDQASDIMNFLDRVDIQEDEMSLLNSLGKAADREFRKAKKSISSDGKPLSVSEAKKQIEDLVTEHEKHLEEKGLREQDIRDLREIAHSYSLQRVGTHILEKTLNIITESNDMRDIIEDEFRNLIGYCVLQVKVQLEENCIEWARDFEEDRLWKAVYITGKVKAVMDESNVRLNSADATNA